MPACALYPRAGRIIPPKFVDPAMGQELQIRLVHSCDHLIAGQATAADKHHMPKIAVLLIQLARLVAHWKLAVGTNRRPDTRLFREGLCHGTTHLRWLSGENKMAKWGK